MRRILACVVVLAPLGWACRPQLPVAYYICDGAGENCFLSARFKDLASCKRHEEISGMLCDRSDAPSEIRCTRDPAPMAKSYCAPE